MTKNLNKVQHINTFSIPDCPWLWWVWMERLLLYGIFNRDNRLLHILVGDLHFGSSCICCLFVICHQKKQVFLLRTVQTLNIILKHISLCCFNGTDAYFSTSFKTFWDKGILKNSTSNLSFYWLNIPSLMKAFQFLNILIA